MGASKVAARIALRATAESTAPRAAAIVRLNDWRYLGQISPPEAVTPLPATARVLARATCETLVEHFSGRKVKIRLAMDAVSIPAASETAIREPDRPIPVKVPRLAN